MSVVPTDLTTWQWPADVLELARREEIDDQLDPLLEATRRLFPTARSIRVYMEGDPELRDVRYITYEVRVLRDDVPDCLAADRSWYEELRRINPGPQKGLLGIHLIREPV